MSRFESRFDAASRRRSRFARARFPASVARNAAILSAGEYLIEFENEGLGIDAAVPGGSVAVKDNTTAANNENNATLADFLTQSGTSPKLVRDSAGTYGWSRHNLFVNSASPATQNITLISGVSYTVRVWGSGSLAGSSGASGTATEGSDSTFTATGTTGTFTLTGSLDRVQINRGSTALEYLATGGSAKFTPALHIDPTHGRGLLVEPAATNLLTQSRDLSDSDWTKSNITATRDVAGIDGESSTGSKLVASANNGTVRQDVTSGSSARITSVFARRRAGTGAVYISQGETTGSELVTNGGFDADTDWTKSAEATITAGVLRITAAVANQATYQAISLTAGKIYRVRFTVSGYSAGNVWLGLADDQDGTNEVKTATISANGTTTAYLQALSGNDTIRLRIANGSTFDIDDVSVEEVVETSLSLTSSYQRFNTGSATITNPPIIIRMATSGDEIDVDFVQQEVTARTSPVATAGATVTRAANALNKATSALPWSATAGTIYINAITPNYSGTNVLWQIDDGTANERIRIERNSSNEIHCIVTDGGTDVADLDLGTVADDTEFQVSFGWEANSFAASLDGGAVVTDTGGTLPAVTTVRAGYSTAGEQWNSEVKKVVWVPRRVTNASLPLWKYAA